jgi:hypothetical protein
MYRFRSTAVPVLVCSISSYAKMFKFHANNAQGGWEMPRRTKSQALRVKAGVIEREAGVICRQIG